MASAEENLTQIALLILTFDQVVFKQLPSLSSSLSSYSTQPQVNSSLQSLFILFPADLKVQFFRQAFNFFINGHQ
jgi:hypothetical protein